MSNKYKIALTSLMGNVIEYFGFTLFAVFSKEIGQSFFPKLDDFVQTLSVFIIFGTGFLSRPLGALFFGHFGDKIGRKKSLSYTILGMSVITFLIAVIPGYQMLAALAPVLLVVLRLCQGFFVGGEGPGAALYILEHSKVENRGMIGGVVIASIITGSFLATLVGILINQLGVVGSFSWRIPFFIASCFGLIELYLRFSLPETDDFIIVQKKNKIQKIPIKTVLKSYWREMMLIASLGGVTTAISYIIMAYFTPYFEKQLNIPHIAALQYSLYSIFLFISFLVLMGKVSVRFGARNFTIAFAYAIIFLLIPAFLAINSDNKMLFLIGISLIPLLSAGLCAPAYPYAIKKFSTEVRYSGVGVSYTLGIAIFGGFAPAICSYLMRTTELSYSPAFYIILLALVYLAFEHILGESKPNEI
ncbi:MFS transporter [Candidatus Bandiella euplotis]|nr:MFS transporter [Candidatus Bandiella woodruffii]